MELWKQMRNACDDLVDEAAALAAPCAHAELMVFAQRLCGMQGLSAAEIRAHLNGIQVPGDFRHFRLTNLTTGMPSGGYFTSFLDRRITVDTIVNFISCVARRDDVTPSGRGVWAGTIALPTKDGGTLELGITFDPIQ